MNQQASSIDPGVVQNMKPGSIRAVHPTVAYAASVEWPTSYVVWDLETSGLEPTKDHILEIGAIVIHDGEVVSEHQWILDNGIEIKPELTAIHGIDNAMVAAEGRDPKQCMEEFMQVLQPGNLPNITHNGYKFDIPWLKHHATVLLQLPEEQSDLLLRELHKSMIDTAALMKGALLQKPRGYNESMKDYAARIMNIMAKGVYYKVPVCCELLDIDMTGITTHRAGGDVVLTNEIYKKVAFPLYVTT